MSVAVNINNQTIKVVAAVQKKITHWETAELAPGLVKDGNILQPEAVAKILSGLFDKNKLPRGDVTASVTGMSFIYRILALPKMKSGEIREAIERATQKEINVPIDELYIDWQMLSEKPDSMEVFVLGAQRGMVEALLKTFKLADLRLASLDLNSLALARLVNQPRALIADFGRDWFDIIIVSEGLPVTLHSVAPKGNLRELEDNLTQLNEEIRRTVDFYNLTHKESSIQADQSVVLSGIDQQHEVERDLINKYLPLASGAPDGQFTYPVSFNYSEYAVLLGLLLKKHQGGQSKKAGRDVYKDINLNLLAGRTRILKNPVVLKNILVPAGIVLAVIVLIPLMLMRNNVMAQNRALQAELEGVNHDLNLRRMILTQAADYETQISKYLTDAKTIRDERDSLSGPGLLAGQFGYVIGGFTANLRYDGITSTANQIMIDGQSDNREVVLSYSSYLEGQNKFAEVRIASIEDIAASGQENTGADSGGVVFRLILERK